MALLPGTPSLRPCQAAGSNGTAPQATTRQQETLLCSVSIRKNDKKTLEGQGRQQGCHEDGNTTRTGRIRGPTGIQLARADCAAEGQADPTKIQVCDDLR